MGMGILYRARALILSFAPHTVKTSEWIVLFSRSVRDPDSLSLSLRHDTYNVLLSRFVDTDAAVTKNSDTKERYLVGDESVTRSKSTGADRIYSRKNFNRHDRGMYIYFI